MASTREVNESPLEQGKDERIAYELTTTPYASSPTDVVILVTDESDGSEDVTSTVTTGSASVAGDVITLPTIHSLTPYHVYRVQMLFVAEGNTWDPYFIIRATR